MQIERLITRRVNAAVHANPTLSRAVHLTAQGGSWVALGILAFQGAGEMLRPTTSKRRWIAPRTLMAVSLVYAITFAMGRVIRRARPFADDADTVSTVGHSPHRSFPSRHVASASAMAMVCARTNPELATIYAGLAIALGCSRVAAGLHYPSDVLAGAVLGSVVGRIARDCSLRQIR